jgi:hypothetical protein
MYTGRISIGRSLFHHHHLASEYKKKEKMTIGDNEVHMCIFLFLRDYKSRQADGD